MKTRRPRPTTTPRIIWNFGDMTDEDFGHVLAEAGPIGDRARLYLGVQLLRPGMIARLQRVPTPDPADAQVRDMLIDMARTLHANLAAAGIAPESVKAP